MERRDPRPAAQELTSPIALQSPQEGTLVSLSMPAAGVEAAVFLRQALGQERFYWQNGRDQTIFAGFGAAAEMMAWGDGRFREIQRKAQHLFAGALIFEGGSPLAAPRLFGGFAFRDDFTPDNTWAVFHPAHFILPHYQLLQTAAGTWLTINAIAPPAEDPITLRGQLQEALETRYQFLLDAPRQMQSGPPGSLDAQISYPMPYDTWAAKIEEAIRRMGSSALDKVVLSRVCEVRLRERIRVNEALAYLNAHYAGCIRFLFEPRPFHAFFGATPELLARVNGRFLDTMSLAGSIRRGRTPAEDAGLAGELLNSEKDGYEHALVVEAIRRRLQPLSAELEVPKRPIIYKLSNIQHLYTPIRACLRASSGILPIVETLHPTPALGGSPRQMAMAFIRHAEPVPRGWYAAPVGWIDHRLDGEFGVAIRSAVGQERRAWLYAGAGIVADSDPQKEWEETELKFRPMLEALGIVK